MLRNYFGKFEQMIHKKWTFYCSGRIIKSTQFGIKIVLNDEAHLKKKIHLITGFITESEDFHFQNGWQKEVNLKTQD